MIIIQVKKDEGIDRATKRYKSKVRKIKLIQQLRERKHFKKPSEVKRATMLKAKYKQNMLEKLSK